MAVLIMAIPKGQGKGVYDGDPESLQAHYWSFPLAHSVQNHVGEEIRDRQPKLAESDSPVRVLGKLCPRCGVVGSVLCETEIRIIYECWHGHQYETKKRLDRGPD
jgi:hypothetical protein